MNDITIISEMQTITITTTQTFDISAVSVDTVLPDTPIVVSTTAEE